MRAHFKKRILLGSIAILVGVLFWSFSLAQGNSDEMHCSSLQDIPSGLSQETKICRTIEKTDIATLKADIATAQPERLLLSGQHIIYDCPISANIDDPIGSCYISAKFVDQIQYPKMAEAFGSVQPKQKLYIRFEADQSQLNSFCLGTAQACFVGSREIYLPWGEAGTHQFYLEAGQESYFAYGTKANGMFYRYRAIHPDNCPTPTLLPHEMIHYFNALATEDLPEWVDESVARMAIEQVMKEVCAPGITFIDVQLNKDGKIVPAANFDFHSENNLTSMLNEFWAGDDAKKKYLFELSKKLREQGLSYIANPDNFGRYLVISES